MHPWIRASDADRQRVVDALHRHTADGRLSLDEFAARADVAYHAVTHADLATLTADLPSEPVRRSSGRGPVVAVLAAAVVLAVLVGGAAVAGVAGWGNMDAMMASMGTVMGGGCR
jgi:predicted phage tail protein